MRFSLPVLFMVVLLLGCADSELQPLTPSADKPLVVGASLTFEDGHFITLLDARDKLNRAAMMAHDPSPAIFDVDTPDDFFTVGLTLCAGDAPMTLDPSTLTVVDSESRQSSPNVNQEQTPALVETDVAPNECNSGWVSFYLPEGENASALIYDAPGYAAVEFDLSNVLDSPSDSATIEALVPDEELMTSLLEGSELTMSAEFHGLTTRELVSLQRSDDTNFGLMSTLYVIGLEEAYNLDSASFVHYEGSQDAVLIQALRFDRQFNSRMYYDVLLASDPATSTDIQPIAVIDARYSEMTDGEKRIAVLEARYFADVWTIALISSDGEDLVETLERIVISIVRRYGTNS